MRLRTRFIKRGGRHPLVIPALVVVRLEDPPQFVLKNVASGRLLKDFEGLENFTINNDNRNTRIKKRDDQPCDKKKTKTNSRK